MGLLKEMKLAAATRYVRSLERFDPKFAEHLLTAQGELFSAAKSFFEAEERHTRKAVAMIRQRAEQAEDTSGSPS
ncbi:hypothetical protein IT570_12885 [Candidatus Sumerlaeota bacterium]|nr:hypothetical protein [Candidatus Sumerlaeota bacterium]